MATQVGSLYYDLTVDDKGVNAKLNEIEGGFKDFSSKVGGALKGAAVAGFIAVATGAGLAAKASWEQVDAVEQATVALRAYERDGNKVNDVLSKLVAYARSDLGVLFNRKDLFQSAQSLKLMGDSTDDLVKHVETLSRSVGLGLSNWEDLNMIVGRVGSTGRLTGDDFDNLTKAGFKLDPAIRNTDQTFQSLFSHLDKGIPADALAGQAETIQGKMIRLQTAFRGVGDAILGVDKDSGKFIQGGLGATLVSGIERITQALNTPEFKQGIKDTVAGITNGFRIFMGVVQQVGVFLQPLTDYIRNNTQAWEVLRTALIIIIGIIAGLIIIIGVVLIAAIALVMGIIQILIKIVEGIIYAFMWLGSVIGGVINWFGQLAGRIGAAMGQIGAAIANGIQGAIDWFASLPGRILGAIGNLGNLLYNVGRDIVNGLVRGIQDVAGNIGHALSSATDGAVKKVKDILGIRSPSRVFAEIGDNMGQGMINGYKKAEGVIAEMTDNMSGQVVRNNVRTDFVDSTATSSAALAAQRSQEPPITVELHMDGIMTRSRTDMREITKEMLGSVNEELRAKGRAELPI